MRSAVPEKLPTVLASSVVRSTHQGESHGGVYVVDLETGDAEQVIDWNDRSISWEGRGLDRGLRGIAFHKDHIYLAASDEILIYTKVFERVGSIRNRYLEHCHETYASDKALYLASSGFDSILEYDFASDTFTRGYCLRYGPLRRKLRLTRQLLPRLHTFDPNLNGGPSPGDTCHLNNVFLEGGVLFAAGTGLRHVLAINGPRLSSYARIPYGSHNARPYRGGVLLNDTDLDAVRVLDPHGKQLQSFPIKRYPEDTLLHSSVVPRDHARQAFARGLCATEDGLIIGGSSPATISTYSLNNCRVLKTVNLTMDVRNAVHGLELWPF